MKGQFLFAIATLANLATANLKTINLATANLKTINLATANPKTTEQAKALSPIQNLIVPGVFGLFDRFHRPLTTDSIQTRSLLAQVISIDEVPDVSSRDYYHSSLQRPGEKQQALDALQQARFYQKMLEEGQNPVAALRTAQLEMWNSQGWQSLYYWAAFTVQGDWQ